MQYQFSDKISSLKPSAIREILKFTQDPSVISFAAGNPAPEAFPVEDIQRIAADILTNNPIGALQYSISEGSPALRDTLKKRMRDIYHVFDPDNDDLIIVSGAQQGIEMTSKVLCNDGDTIICESPSFIGSLNAFRSYEVNLVGVDMDNDGINIEKLEAALKREKNVRFIYLIPNFQNPSGITMSLEKRKAVYELAKQYGVMILEDNPYGDLRFEGEDIPNIKSLDTDGIVIYCGSFSKLISPGMRVGWTIANKQVIQKLVVAKQASDVHTNILAQMICDRFLNECDMDAHIRKMQDIYRHKCGLMIDLLHQHFDPHIQYTTPQGGLFLWCTLPEGIDMMGFCTKSVENKVALVPGTAFTAVEGEPSSSFRMNYSTPTDEELIRGMEIVGKLTKELF